MFEKDFQIAAHHLPSDDVDSDAVKAQAVATVNAIEVYTEDDFERVRKKQDRYLMPIMWIIFGVQQVDKTGLATQATFGIRADTHLVGNQYAWLTTIFFIAYLVGEFPGNYIMQRFSVGKTLSLCMFFWSIIVFCTAAARNWTDLMVLRALQGFAESVVSPGLLIITGLSYRKEEHAFRTLIWGTANYGFAIIVALINYGIGRAGQKDPGGLAAWKGMSLFLGALTVVVSILSFFMLGTPREVRWLSLEEKKIQAARVAHNGTGSDAQKRSSWKWSQVRDAFKDPQTHFFFFVTVSNSIPTGGVNTFGNLIYVSLGFTPLDTLLQGTLPQNALGVAWFIVAGIVLSKFRRMRFYFIMLSIIPAFVGMLVLSLVPTTKDNLWGKWGAYFITIIGQICGSLVWSMLTTNVAGRTKKSVTAIVIFIAYCFGNAVGAQAFQSKWAPVYRNSTIILAVMFGLEFSLVAAWRIYFVRKNASRSKSLDAAGISAEERVRLCSLEGETDATDIANPYFVYDY